MTPRWGRLALPLLLALLTAPVAAQAAPAVDSPEALVQAAEALVEEGSEESLAAAAGKYVEAAQELEQAGAAEKAAEAHRGRGKILVRAGDFDAAIAAYEAAEVQAAKAGVDSLELEIIDDIGYAHYRAGRREEAVATLLRKADRARALGDRVREADALGNIGSVYNTWSEPQKALDYYRRALEIRRQVDDRDGMGSALGNLGLLYAELGQPERALDLFEEALAVHRAAKDVEGESATLRNIGSAYQDLGDLDRAVEFYNQSLVVEDDTFGRMIVHDALGDIGRLRGRDAEAAVHFRRGLTAAQELKRPVAEANLMVALATVTTGGAAAWELLDRASQIYGRAARTAEVSVVERERARLLRNLGRYEDAETHIEQAIAIREAIRSELIGDDLRASSFGSWRQLYEIWAGILLDYHEQEPTKGYDQLAFEVAERARARGLLEAAALSGFDDPSVVDPARRIQLAAVDKQISYLQRKLRSVADSVPEEEKDSDEAGLRELVRQREQLREEIDRAAHDPHALLGLETVSAAEVRSSLVAGTALLEYLVSEEGSFLFVVTPGGLAAHRLPTEEHLERLIRNLRASLEQPRQIGLGSYVTPALDLYREIVEPALSDLEGVDHLIIAADGPLHQLPFEALLTEAPAVAGFVDQPYLLRSFDVSYTPSASVLALLGDVRDASDGKVTSALVVAGPFAAENAGDDREGRRDLVRSVFGPDGDWNPPPLVAARGEADGIREALGEERVQALLGDEATEAAVKGHPALTEARYLHFATHALVSQRDPALSAVVLALDPEDEEDGLLQVSEIERLGLTADLVVLSACQTALGREVRGEGMLGLTRAFLAAGTRSLVASLWSVADESTAELMVAFYGELASGADKTAALRQAKLKLIEGETFAHPFYWAPFVLQGAAN